jgi:hypothetical protein
LSSFTQYIFSHADEVAEEGVRATGPGEEFRVELAAYHPGVVGQFADLNQSVVGGSTAVNHACLMQRLTVFVVKFIAVPVAFLYQGLTVSPGGEAVLQELAWVITQAHRGSLVFNLLLFGEKVDDRITGGWAKFRRVRFV